MSSNDIYPYQLIGILGKGTRLDIIDIRSKTDYNIGHISTAKHVPISNKKRLMQAFETLKQHNNPILYCNTGIHSKMIAEELRAKGFSCRILLGGFAAFFFAARLKAGMICNPFNLQPIERKLEKTIIKKSSASTNKHKEREQEKDKSHTPELL